MFNGMKNGTFFLQATDQLGENYMPQQAKRDSANPSEYIGICFDRIYFAFVTLDSTPDGTMP